MLYIIFALTVTLSIVYISLNDRYMQYYESKLIEKTKRLSYNTAILLAEKYKSIDGQDIETIFNLAFSASSNKDSEIVNYALYRSGDKGLIASNMDDTQIDFIDSINSADAINTSDTINSINPLNPIDKALDCFRANVDTVEYSDTDTDGQSDDAQGQVKNIESSYTYVHGSIILSYAPVIIDNVLKYVVLVSADYEPFILFGEGVRSSLYSALFKGCLIMVSSYVVFSIRSNVGKTRKRDESNPEADEEEASADIADKNKSREDRIKFYELLKIQAVPITIGMIAGFPLLRLFFSDIGIFKFVFLILSVIMLALSAVHILRLLYWLLLWYINRPISGYSAQAAQFCIFLSVFIAVFCYSAQNSYNMRIERSRLDGLRQSSIFAAMTLSNALRDNADLNDSAQDYQFDKKSQSIVITRTEEGFQIIGNESENIAAVQSLLDESWNGKKTVMGIKGGYIYGITPVLDEEYEVTALLGLRQAYSLYAEEMRRNTIDFILGMSVTVLAFIIFFIELNKLLEVLNTPEKQGESRSLTYVPGVRSLVFFAVMCRYIPLFFFTLIVQSIYDHNPVSWLPINLAKTLPLALILPVITFGSRLVDTFYKIDQRTSIMTGCVVAAGSFLLIAAVGHFALYLILLVLAYTGVSMVYNGLWDYTKYVSRLEGKYPQVSGIKKITAGGDFIGSTVGAVFGAVAYDKFGLFAALLLSAVILLCLSALVRYMMPKPKINWSIIVNRDDEISKHNSLPRFFKSRDTIFYAAAIIFPFTVVPYFINQFSPIYANSIQLSTSAVSWTSLLQALCIAYISPKLAQWLARRLKSSSVLAAVSNILAASGLFLFAAFPGILTLYIASAIIGIGLGAGRTAVVEGYDALEGTLLYKNKDAAFFSFTLIGGQMGTVFFTVAHSLSSNGEFVFIIAALVVICSVLYMFSERKRGAKN